MADDLQKMGIFLVVLGCAAILVLLYAVFKTKRPEAMERSKRHGPGRDGRGNGSNDNSREKEPGKDGKDPRRE